MNEKPDAHEIVNAARARLDWTDIRFLSAALDIITDHGLTAELASYLDDSLSSTARWFTESKAAGCTGTSFNSDDDTIAHEKPGPCPVHPGL